MKWGYGVIPVGPLESSTIDYLESWTQKAPKGWPLKTCRASAAVSPSNSISLIWLRDLTLYIYWVHPYGLEKVCLGGLGRGGDIIKLSKGKNGDQYLGRGLVTPVSILLVEKVWYHRILLNWMIWIPPGWLAPEGSWGFQPVVLLLCCHGIHRDVVNTQVLF